MNEWCDSQSLVSSLLLNESSSVNLTNTTNVAHFVLEGDSIELVGTLKQFWPEGGCDELGIVCQSLDQHCGGRGRLTAC